MRRASFLARSLGAALFAVTLPVFAEEAPASDAANNASVQGELAVSWTIPDSPAAAALDVARSETSPPTIARLISYELLNADDAVGVAGEVSPYLLWTRARHGDAGILSIDDYQEKWATRALARLSLSAAVLPSAESGDRAAAALRWTVFNLGDPYNDRELFNAANPGDSCLGRAILTTLGPAVAEDQLPANRDTTVSAPNPDRVREVEICRKAQEEKAWNATALQVSAVQLWRSDDGIDQLGAAGARYSTVFSYGFEGFSLLRTNSQLLISAARGDHVEVLDKSGAAQRRDETRYGLRLRVAPGVLGEDGCHSGNGRCFNVYGEAALSENDYEGGEAEDEWAYTVGAEWEVRENMWLGVSTQRRSGDDVTGDESRAGLQLRFAFTEEAQFGRE